jgi:hypothetical protein
MPGWETSRDFLLVPLSYLLTWAVAFETQQMILSYIFKYDSIYSVNSAVFEI